MTSDHRRLCKALGYTFADEALLEQALTHRSKHGRNYERLEFLGDSILEFVVSSRLYEDYPDLSEGKLTRLRASLVKKDTLAGLAREIGVGDCLLLGSGELKSGGFDRDSILADAMEAIFGAVYIDGGIDKVREVILSLYRETLAAITPDKAQKDPKTRLQEYLQRQSKSLPHYTTVNIAGEAHNQTFVVECMIPGLEEPVRGRGPSRRKAEQEAAAAALQRLRTPQ